MPSKHWKNRKRKQEWYNKNAPDFKKRKLDQPNSISVIHTFDSFSSHQQWYRNKARIEKLKAKICYKETCNIKRSQAQKRYADKPEPKRSKERQKYAANPEGKQTKERQKYAANPEGKQTKERQKYAANPENKKFKERQKYAADPEIQRLRKRQQYVSDPEPKRTRKRQQHAADNEANKKKCDSYYAVKKERLKMKQKQHHKAFRLSRLQYFRIKYKRNIFSERSRKISAYYTRSYITSNNSYERKNRHLSNRKKQKRSINTIFMHKFNSELTARIFAKQLRGPNFSTRLLRAKELLKWALYAYKSHFNNFRNIFMALRKQCREGLERLATAEAVNEVEALCGVSHHTSHSEPYFWEFTYKPFSGKVIAIDQYHRARNIFPSFAEILKDGKLTYAWNCSNEICLVQREHIMEHAKSFFINVADCSFKGSSKLILDIAQHSSDHNGLLFKRQWIHPHSIKCYTGSCVSKLPFMRTLSPHFPDIRALISKIYKLMGQANKMIRVKESIRYTDINRLLQIENDIKELSKAYIGDVQRDSMLETESELLDKYHKAFQLLEKRSLETPIFPCVSCDKLFSTRQISLLKNLKIPIAGQVWVELKSLKQEESKDGCICRACLEKLRKDEMPPNCILNGLMVSSQPQELRCLNSYEKIIIQRAKAFQVVTKMKPIGGKQIAGRQQISKVVGRSFHLPLPLIETLKRLPQPSDPLNYNHELYLLVRGVPTKSKHVWEMLVSVDKIYNALKYLQRNNCLYSNISLPEKPQQLLDPVENVSVFEIDNQAPEQLEPALQRRALLTQVSPEQWDAEESHYTIHALHESKSCRTATELYQMLKINEPPIGFENKHLDLLCFPDLFPEGKFGQFYPRLAKLTSAEFIKCRLLSRNSQFRLNQQYLFYLLHDANMRQLRQGIFHKLNVAGFKGSLTAGQYLSSLCAGELEGNLTSIFSKLRNTSQYWIQPRNDVNCMAQHYGPATWFLTMSPSEWNWDDMALYIRKANHGMPELETKQTSALVALDPVSASRFIDNKFNAMLAFLLSEDAPLGKVKHYFYRREYQSRGLQHFHLLLWIEDAPVLGTSSNAEVAEFILRYVSCKLPVPSVSPTIYSRVNQYQIHHHNSYCLRNKKTKTGFRKVCRFGFPRSVTETLVLRDVVQSVAGRKALKSKTRLYDLPRSPRERNINDYNPAVLLAWNGNVDLQYVGEKTSILHWYVTKYTTKSEQSHVGQTFTEINSTKSLASKLFNVGLRALNNRECGALEASDTLLGIPLYGTDPDTTIRWLDVGMIRHKRLLKIDSLRNMDPSSKNIFYKSWVDDHYPARPSELEDINLYDFFRWFDIINNKLKNNRESYELSSGKYLTRRLCPYLINHYKYSFHQEPEKYYHALLLMFLPWRAHETLKGDYENYTTAFFARKDKLQQAVDYDKRLKELTTSTEETRERIKAKVQEFEAEDQGEDADPLNAAFKIPIESVPVQSITKNQSLASEDRFNDLHQSLNSDQLRVFEHVMRVLLNSERKGNVLRHFVSGVGGTGKSFLIKTIASWTKQCLQLTTSISAPTGLSAYNINGSTIYKVFRLPVEHGRTPKYRALSDDALKELRTDLRNVLLFVIDEVSMISNLTLMYINLRLCEIFDTADEDNGWFGKKHILLFGDLLQLPPVHEDSPFMELSYEKLNNYVGSLTCINIWLELFTYDELIINMRQVRDTRYADILSRVRIGILTLEDMAFIAGKKINLGGKSASENLCLLGDYLVDLPEGTVCICATGYQCSKINDEMLNRISGSVIKLVAKDSVECDPRDRKKVNKLLISYDSDCSRTAGMEKEIPVKVGAKVMLRRNIDVTLGLVNSAIGIIVELKFNLDKPNEVDSVNIRFDSGTTHSLQRVTAKFEIIDNAYVFREQFPISISYAVTIHKCQGLSLKSALMDIGESVFTCGQSYVALSRVTSSEGLHLINFNPRNVKSQTSAVMEYNRLREKYRPDISPYCSSNGPQLGVYVKDRKWCQTKGGEEVQQNDNNVLLAPERKVRSDRNRQLAWPNIRGLSNNDNVSCYANALVQLLYTSAEIRQVIKSSNQVCLEFRDHLLRYEGLPPQVDLDTMEVRRSTASGNYTNQEQQDCALFLLDLLERNTGLLNTISYCLVSTSRCNTCGYTFRGEEEQDNIIRVPMHVSLGTLEAQLRLAVSSNWEFLPDYRCNNKLCNVVGSTRRKVEITTMKRHVLLQFLIFSNHSEKIVSVNLKRVPNCRVTLCGKIYKPAAAIFHHGNTIFQGHYTCFIKSGKHWICANDRTLEKKRWPNGSKDLYMLLLQECYSH